MTSHAITQPAGPQPSDLRQTTRERLFLPARASYAHGAISTACTVVQLSATGARLNIDTSFTIPEIFELSIPQRGIDCRARLVWREGAKAGVEFLAEAPISEPSAEDYVAKIKTLEQLNAKFKAQIAELTVQVRRLTEET